MDVQDKLLSPVSFFSPLPVVRVIREDSLQNPKKRELTKCRSPGSHEEAHQALTILGGLKGPKLQGCEGGLLIMAT